MKEIKFRAWFDGDEFIKSRMVNNVQEIFDGDNYSFRVGNTDVIGHMECFADLLKDKNFTVMQFTGKRDINGTEIYEKDILGDTEGYVRGTVLWSEEELTWVVGVYEYLWEIEPDRMEILGNVYENPELLPDKEESA